MNKSLKFLLIIAPLALSGCDFNFSSIFGKGGNNEVPGDTSSSEDGKTTPTDNDPTDSGTVDSGTDIELEQVITDKIEGMYMNDAFITVKTDKYVYATVGIEYADGYDWESAGDEIEWTTSNSSIATVSSVGKVTGISKGHVTLTAKLKVSKHTCSTTIYVIENDSDITKTWKKLGSSDEINDKDTIIIACSQESKAATDVDTGHELHSTDVTLSVDKNTMTNVGGAAQFYVYRDYKGRDGYNFEVLGSDRSKFLGCTNTDNVSYFDTAKTTSTLWSLDYDSENCCWDMRSATNVDGWMMYNKDTQKFANYQSNETAFMFVVSLYRLTYTYNV